MPISALDEEIALLRERLEGAEEMRRAIRADQLDGFVVGDPEPVRVELLVSSLRETAAAHGEVLPPPAVTVARSGRILHANHRFAALTGQALRDLYSSPVAELFAEEDREGVAALVEAARPDATLDVVFRRPGSVPRAGRLVTIDVSHASTSFLLVDLDEEMRRSDAESALAAIRTGDIDGVVVGGEQIILVAGADRSYRDLVDRIGQGALSVTWRGDVLYANEPFAAMLGLPREDVLGRNLLDLVAEGERLLRDFLARPPTERATMEIALRRREGDPLPVAVSAEAMPGPAAAAMLVLTDLTEQRRHLKMQEETRRKDEFLAVLAHELRNPLASIRSCAQVLDRATGLDAQEIDCVRIIGRQSATLVRLVDDLLDIHRLNQGKLAVRLEPVLLDEIVHDAIDAARPYLSTRGLRLDVALAGEPLYVEGDKVRLTQVLLNLLSNAAKFTAPEGVVTIQVERVEDGARQGTGRISVTDDGCGIEPAQLESIFEPYVQVNPVSDTPASGLGLGLSVARRLVELHGGRIRAESPGPGQGSCFVLELPQCKAPAARPAAPATAAAAGADDRLRVLIADDNRDAAESLAMLVRLSGHDVRTAHDGHAALAAGEAFRPDIVFLDIGMPVLDGYATARRWRASHWGRGSRLYALTGYGHDAGRQRLSHEAGFDSHFVKPIDPEQVVSLLREAAVALRAAPASPGNGADRRD